MKSKERWTNEFAYAIIKLQKLREGSYVRGDYTPDSDVDMMILVKGIAPENLWRYKKPIIKAESELGLQYD